MKYVHLYRWGLTEHFASEAAPYENLVLARVTEQHRDIYKTVCEDGFVNASVSGKFLYNAYDNAAFPAVGDWVMIETDRGTSVIHRILPRGSVFERKAAGTGHAAQVVAANIDMAFICMALNEDYNLRRLERYLSVAWDSGAKPLVVLTKSDLCDDVDEKLGEVKKIAMDTEVVVCSSMTADGYDAVSSHIGAGLTVAFIGSSGVGKSTLINRLMQEDVLATNELRNDGKGRHTTTHRQLMPLPNGGVVIDTPGMRELGAIGADLGKSFTDVEELIARCRFHDCSHNNEPGCAVRAAIEDGTLDASRFANYKKLQTETSYESLSSKQIEEEKIKRMFGGKNKMKQTMREIKQKSKRR